MVVQGFLRTFAKETLDKRNKIITRLKKFFAIRFALKREALHFLSGVFAFQSITEISLRTDWFWVSLKFRIYTL